MGRTLQFTEELTVVVCWCGMHHAVPATLRRTQLSESENGRDHWVYCPAGHKYGGPAGETKLQKAERRLEAEREERARVAAERDQAQASARAHKGAATRARKRAASAVCPCCHRSFKQLRRHMATKHPDYDPEVGK